MFSNVRTGRMYFSFPPARNIIIVSGTKLISETSFVTNMDVKKTEKTKNSERFFIFERRLVLRSKGAKMFSCLKPSRTERSMNKVARVRQSMFFKRSESGGVIKSDAIAASRETLSISSFLKIEIILFICFVPTVLFFLFY